MNINLVAYDAVEIMAWLAMADRSVTSAELAMQLGARHPRRRRC